MSGKRDDNLKRLRNALAQLYPQEAQSRMVADDADLDSANISFDANAQVNWHAILSQASKEDKIIDIIDRTLEDYKANEILKEMKTLYEKKIANKDSPSTKENSRRGVTSRHWLILIHL